MKKYSCEELLQKLKEFSKKTGTVYLSKAMVDSADDMPASATFKRYFGSWGKALALAGLKKGIMTGRPQGPPIILTREGLDIIEGELLGDGTLEKASANASFSHSTANWAYSDFLFNSLINSDVFVKSVEFLPPRNNGKPQKRIRTTSNITFTKIRNIWYPNGIKVVPDGLTLNKVKCLHWYLGDGYTDGKVVMFSTCGFKMSEVEFLAGLLTNLGFKSYCKKRSGGYYIIYICRQDSVKFLEWLGPCPVAGYEHKWRILDEDIKHK